MADWFAAVEAAFRLGDEAEPAAPPPVPRQAPAVQSFWCVVAQPSGRPGDLGETVACHYVVNDGVLWLCDEHGKAGDKRHVLADGEEPRRVASRLRRAAWQSEPGRSAFNRPLHQLAEPYGGY